MFAKRIAAFNPNTYVLCNTENRQVEPSWADSALRVFIVAMTRPPVLLFLVLVFLFPLIHAEPPSNTISANHALVTIASEEHDLLPARTLLHSARRYANLSLSVPRVLLTGPTVPHYLANAIADADNLTLISLPNPSLIHLFNLPYRRVLFLSPHLLVTASLAPLLHCPALCASFISPCSFSTNLMVLTPNVSHHAALTAQRTAHDADRLHGPCASPRPDGLSIDDCLINARFGKTLLAAPLFTPDNLSDTVPPPSDLPSLSASQMHRLPMGCLVAHYFYYPRFQWEIPVNPCGVIRLIDFSWPSVARPWRWWAYPIASLSWRWLTDRNNLPKLPAYDRLQGRRLAVSIFLLLVVITATLFALLSTSRLPNRRPRVTSRAKRDHQLPLVSVAVGLPAAGLSFLFAVRAVPTELPPRIALPLFMAWHFALILAAFLAVGAGVIRPLVRIFPPPPSGKRGTSLLSCTTGTFAIALAVVLLHATVIFIANVLKVQTIFDRAFCLVIASLSYVIMLVPTLSGLGIMWIDATSTEIPAK